MLLEKAGFDFTVRNSQLDETVADHETVLGATARLAIEKALTVSRHCEQDTVVLGADTVVVVGERMLGKPADPGHAVELLMELSGRNHSVITAWALVAAPADRCGTISGFTVSTVRMRDIGRDEACAYVAGGEPLDKAGAYAVQGEGKRFVAAVLGSLDNVIGLPVAQVARALAECGVVPARARD